MRAALVTASALVLAACTPEAQPVEPAATETASTMPLPVVEIESVMQDSATGWNEGDMDRFLAIYSDAPDTSFVGSGGLMRGKDAMEDRYREAYDWSQPGPAERGVLTFETEDIRALGERHALYIGRYILTYPDGREPATGFTSLVFAREPGGWKIVADHSS
ncbi:SgcJ/EcaC family oxidoreductase [Aurantiacibacter rhizosphaerae]|uniref:SgcJ/EcaC family oxidoreductase n=1 Tax=Aurantiacibacter rhizosphaerae TaxID=2691582 RepID=A0A844XGX9_9SPHN|nr:SgcJ/EcaC family oxidoreductase [Aurantiacibacter rhizosphaerae]MWV28912.1 SgcJ/EcaC family oxidoreductase [Aurantiacibacter rhizosphaerae]